VVDNSLAHSLPAIYRSLGLPFRLDAFRSHSDGNLFFAAGTKPIILGPGALESAHTPDEQVPFSEVSAAASIYAAICLEADDPSGVESTSR
jgi:acetylornithine deacetylase